MSTLRILCLIAIVLFATRAAAQPTLTTSRNKQDGQAAKPVATFAEHPSGVTALAFISPDGRRVMSACSQDVRTWDPATGKEIEVLKGVGGEVVAFSRDGKRLMIAGWDKVTIHDAASGKEQLGIEPHGDWNRSFPFRPAIASVAFSPDGQLIATGGSVAKVGGEHGLPGGIVTIWDAKTGRAIHRFDTLSTGVCTVTFSSDGKLIAAGTNGAGGELPEPGEVWVWNVESRKTVRTFRVKAESDYGEYIAAADVAFSPDGKWVAAAVRAGGRGRPAGLIIEDKASTVRIWELASGQDVRTLSGHNTGIERLAFSPDGKHLAAAGGDRAVRLWSTATGKELKAFPFDTPQIDALAFSPDGLRLAAGAGGKEKPSEIKVWSVNND